ncbi:MAG: septum formation inhibitor [Tenuifilaceae bacterium]|nr:septum formation inhibitor [Tenuifilaceae bacterium]
MTIASFWKAVYPWLRNKYILTIAIFLLWMLLFDSSNWIDVYREFKKIEKFEKEKEYYLQKIENDRKRLNELRTNNENLEKFAREQYLMKKPDEEIFVIMPD